MGYMEKNPDVSVVVASHRSSLITGLLDSLQRQGCSRISFEVLVVTDYPNGDLQNRYAALRWLYTADRSISRKRNLGASIAQAAVLAFIDDDCIAAPDWLEQGYRYLTAHQEAAAVEGHTAIETASGYSPQATREYRRLEKPGFRTNNLFLRTAAFRAVGGFDERFTVQREDIDLAFSLLEQGHAIDYHRDIRVTHRFRHWEKWDLLKNCWNRRFDPLLFLKHPKRYWFMFRVPLPPTQAIVLFLHLLVLLSIGRKGKRAPLVAAADGAVALFFGIRRSGLRPFSPEKWLRESIQLVAAPVVVAAALVYGFAVLPGSRGSQLRRLC
jgi:glycosyltransferase involved in cell wall biosynthesis